MAEPVPQGISPGPTVAMIRHYRCENCGMVNEIRLRDVAPLSHYNTVKDYCVSAAGNEWVLLPVLTLEQMGADRERLARQLDELAERYSQLSYRHEEAEAERDAQEERYEELLEAVGGVWPG